MVYLSTLLYLHNKRRRMIDYLFKYLFPKNYYRVWSMEYSDRLIKEMDCSNDTVTLPLIAEHTESYTETDGTERQE